MDRTPSVLRFSTTGAAFHSLIGTGFLAIFLYFAWQFALGPINVPTTTFSRNRWFYELGNTGDGWTGIVICFGLAALCGLWLIRAAWRLVTRLPALALEGPMLRFHPSYRVRKIPLDEVSIVHVREVAPARLLGLRPPIYALELILRPHDGFRSPRKIQIISNSVEGGLPALREMEGTIRSHAFG